LLRSARQVFLGSLREIELERVKEKLSSAIMETCLALTIFRCARVALARAHTCARPPV
jgi:CRISPR/Cas system-associated endoribonuclease Cas2